MVLWWLKILIKLINNNILLYFIQGHNYIQVHCISSFNTSLSFYLLQWIQADKREPQVSLTDIICSSMTGIPSKEVFCKTDSPLVSTIFSSISFSCFIDNSPWKINWFCFHFYYKPVTLISHTADGKCLSSTKLPPPPKKVQTKSSRVKLLDLFCLIFL